MSLRSQIFTRPKLIALVVLCALPSCAEAYAIAWGQLHGLTGKALRDGLDFWAGGFLALHGDIAMLFDPLAYQSFLAGAYGKLPYHLWSYPPNYLLLAAGFGWLSPWHAVLAFDFCSLLLLAAVLRLSRQSFWLIAAVAASPASLENLLEHQNAALLTALIGGGLLLLRSRPRLGGLLIGLATIKPQLGLILPLFLLRRSPIAFAYAALAALLLAYAALHVFGPAVWTGFLHFTAPVMSNVLLTGQPPDFAGGLISVFALARPLGVHQALLIQGAVTLAAVLAALKIRSPATLLILAALATPYLHDYDLLGVALATALLLQDRLVTGFLPGEPLLYFLAWFGPGLLPWAPQFAHATPILLLLLLASALRRGGLIACDSSQVPPALPVSSAGRSPIPAPQNSTVPG
jgi:alpha-1,2-mannosyltransferase